MTKKKLPEPPALNNYHRYKPCSADDAARAGRIVAELLMLDLRNEEAIASFMARNHHDSPALVRCAVVLAHETLAAAQPRFLGFGDFLRLERRTMQLVRAFPRDRRKGACRTDVMNILTNNKFGNDDKTDDWWRENLGRCAPEFRDLTTRTIAVERANRREKNTVYPTIAAALSLAVGAFGDASRPGEMKSKARERISLRFRNAEAEPREPDSWRF